MPVYLQRTLFFAFLLVIAQHAVAASRCTATIEELKAQSDDPAYGRYAYEVFFVSREKQRHERFDPGLPAGSRWRLLSVGSAEPTDEQRNEHTAQRAQSQSGYRFEDLFDPLTLASLEFTGQEAGWQRYSFKPAPSADEDEESRAMTRQLAGEMLFQQSPDCFIEYKLLNDKPFKPATGVKIDQFELSIVLRALPGSGVFYPANIEQKISGKAFMFKTIDEFIQTRYSGHELMQP